MVREYGPSSDSRKVATIVIFRMCRCELAKKMLTYIPLIWISIKFDEDKDLYYGFEEIYNYVDSEAYTESMETGTKNPVETPYPYLATYAKYEQDLASNITAIAGTRYSHTMLDAQFDQSRFDQFDEISFNT